MNEQWKTKLTLIERAQADPESVETWEEFTKFYSPFIQMILIKHRTHPNSLEDLQQDILLKIWKSIPKYDKSRAGFRTWLYTIIRNEIINYVRRYSKARSRDNDYYECDTNESFNDLDKLIDQEWRTHITNLAFEKLKNSFSENSVAVFSLSLKGYKADKIASDLGLTKETVFVLRSQFKKELAREISKIRQHIEL